MSITSHIEALRRKHAALSEKVEAAQSSPGFSDTEIVQLKKQKLQVKEEITRLETA